MNTANMADNYRPRGVGPKQQLTGTDTVAYAPWKWAVNDKLRIDAAIYPTEMDRISYAFSQLAQPIFPQLDPWIQANSENLTMEEFFSEIEHYMGIPMLAATAKRELNTVVMRSNEAVNEYYHGLFKLWQQASTPEDEKIDKFKLTLKPSISHALLAFKHTNMRDLLDAARLIEDQKKEISNNFPREPKPMQKPFKTWTSRSQAGGSSTVAPSAVTTPASGGSATAAREGRPTINTSSAGAGASANAQFMPTSTRPQGWVGTWYNHEPQPRKLQGDDRATLSRQGRCWGCRGSGHRGNDECCPSHAKRLNAVHTREERFQYSGDTTSVEE